MTDPTARLSKEAQTLLAEKRSTKLPPVQERRQLREAAGFNFREMGIALGIGTSTAHRWEVEAKRLPPAKARPYLDLLAAWRGLSSDQKTDSVQDQK